MNREEIWQMANARATRSHCEADFRGMFWSTVVGIAGVASLISGWTDKYPMWTPSGRSSYATCQTWPPRLAKWHREIGKTSQMTHRIAEGMHTGLVQWVQWTKDSQTEAKSLRALHGEPWEIRIPPEYQAASTLENNFLFWPRRFMTLEIHLLQMRKCCEAAGVELWAKIGPLAISSLNSGTSAICKSQGGFQDKQNRHCMAAGMELETIAIGHETSNGQSEKSRTALVQHSLIATWVANWLVVQLSSEYLQDNSY